MDIITLCSYFGEAVSIVTLSKSDSCFSFSFKVVGMLISELIVIKARTFTGNFGGNFNPARAYMQIQFSIGRAHTCSQGT
jgi:hypothetical protein